MKTQEVTLMLAWSVLPPVHVCDCTRGVVELLIQTGVLCHGNKTTP